MFCSDCISIESIDALVQFSDWICIQPMAALAFFVQTGSLNPTPSIFPSFPTTNVIEKVVVSVSRVHRDCSIPTYTRNSKEESTSGHRNDSNKNESQKRNALAFKKDNLSLKTNTIH